MSADKLYSEIFEDFDKCTTKAERVALLQKYDHKNFREFFVAAFNDSIEFDVEIPSYRPAPEPGGSQFYIFEFLISEFVSFHQRTSFSCWRIDQWKEEIFIGCYPRIFA